MTFPGWGSGGGWQPGGIAGGAGQGPQWPPIPGAAPGGAPPAAGGGGHHFGFGQGMGHGMGGQGMQGLLDRFRNARTDFQGGMAGMLGGLPGHMGMQPRPGGTAGGSGWAMPSHFQMPQGFASHLPWGQAAGGGGAPGAQGIAAGEPNPAAPGGYGMNARSAQSDAINKMAGQNNKPMHRNDDTGALTSGGTGMSAEAKAEQQRKAQEIGKRAKGY